MKALMYLYKRTFVNRARKAVRKPATYLLGALILFYVVIMPISFRFLLEEFGFDTPEGMTAVFTIVVFWLIPANLISYAKRKGLIFKKSDVHFMFTSPVSPKNILLYAHMKTLGIYMLMSIVILACGLFLFHVPLWKLAIYFVVSMGIENLMEASLMVLMYGSERISERGRKLIVTVCYAVVGLFVAIALLVYVRYDLSLESALYFLHCDWVQMVPVVGWYIGLVHLIFMGPTTVNIICSILYLAFTAGVFLAAWKMPCSGEYYEDAMKFAEDYEELRAKKRDGEAVRLGRKEKFGKATVVYKGGGAKAIYYKQLLEYKKSKFFFFDTTTIIMVGIGIFLGVMYSGNDKFEQIKAFIIPGIMSYLAFCMSAAPGKWGKEIKSPYTFLIPDSPMKKLWYATILEHIKSFACGVLIAIPLGIILKLPVGQIILSILCYVCLMSCRLYNLVMVESLFGSAVGKTGKQLLQLLLQSLVIGVALTLAAVGTIFISIEAGYLLMIFMLLIIVFALMTVAAGCFERMETAE